ncbi:MAG: 30S ribosomal protein S19 [Nanoarchaeota archaeon]
MAKKEFSFRGKSIEELQAMSLNDLADLFTARIRRTIKRGFTDEQKRFLQALDNQKGRPVKTHCRDMIVLPSMVGKTIQIHNGKDFVTVAIQAEMIGHRLGEYALSRKRILHSSPGVGATKSSSAISAR